MEPSASHVPRISLQPPEVDFIDIHLDSRHPAFATPPARYSPSHGVYIICEPLDPSQSLTGPESSWDPTAQSNSSTPRNAQIPSRPLAAERMVALKFWDNLFHRAMNQLVENHPTGPNSKPEFSIRDKDDCTAVFDQLENAKESYCKKDKSFKSRSIRIYRKVTDNAAEPLLGASKFVPNIDYVTPVLGAVQILLEAAIKAAKVRQEVLSAFDDIDKVFNQVEGYLQIYSNDENLEKAAVDLIVAVFHAIEWKKAISVTFNKEGYQEAITESLSAIKVQGETLMAQADMSGKFETSNGLQTILDRMPLSEEIEDIRHSQHFLKTMFMRFLHDYDMNSRELHISPHQLLDWINIPDLPARDVEIIRSTGYVKVPAVERARADQLVNTTQFKDWFVSPRSAQLLIHGNYDIRRRLSGLTLLCTSLAESLSERSPQCLYLIFYCGLHTNNDFDEDTGGLDVIRSFIRQLLCQYDFSNCILVGDVRPDLLCLGNIDELCCLFERLIHQLPRHTLLVCIIDGAIYYEREEFMQSMAEVLVTLLRISNEQRTGASVKVLLTSPTKTMSIRKPFPDDLVLCMEARARSGVLAGRGRLERQLDEQMDSRTGFVYQTDSVLYQ
ncbi:hypothetical protein FSPOR_10778 [Fusarium sporotrichioides]|uniref:Nephrocystin 3-like N-terminal domain-containing protein n=1 Tax=Fusarium sporotrichioides TaxID=5514 RepID=A0A395RK88_FUSSP|nr:hypothetical protein FSPOR_10778 [Fusarium sporotrichioides]